MHRHEVETWNPMKIGVLSFHMCKKPGEKSGVRSQKNESPSAQSILELLEQSDFEPILSSVSLLIHMAAEPIASDLALRTWYKQRNE